MPTASVHGHQACTNPIPWCSQSEPGAQAPQSSHSRSRMMPMLSGPTPPSADSGALRKPCAAATTSPRPPVPCIQAPHANDAARTDAPEHADTAQCIGLRLTHARNPTATLKVYTHDSPWVCMAHNGSGIRVCDRNSQGPGAARTRTSGASFSSLSRRL